MYLWMQANRKKMLAIFGVLLMIVFILPTTPRMMGGGDSAVGHIGEDEPITRMELARAHGEWAFLAGRVATIARWAPWQEVLFSSSIVEAINRNPELFILLCREAERVGVQANRDQVEELLRFVNLTMPPPASIDEANIRRSAIEHLLLVGNAFDRAASAIKISEPRIRHEIAEQFQTVRLGLVEFAAADYLDKAPAPTAEQVREQIDRFGDVDPLAIDPKTNPFGFSYRLPNRVKLQYIKLPREQVRQAVEKSHSEFEWRSQAYAYYQDHPALYQVAEPATQESAFQDDGGLSLGASTRPATRPSRLRPFDEVYPEIKRDLLRPRVDQRMKQIQDRVASLLQKGYDRYEALKADRPAPEGSGIKADYDHFDYLQQVAEQIQKEFGITPTVQAISNRWLTESDLMTLKEIGQAMRPGQSPLDTVRLADYVISRAEPFRPNDERADTDTLSLWEPSGALVSPSQDVFYLRLTDAQAAHAPATDEERQEVAARAEADWKTAAAYELALKDARSFYEGLSQGRLEEAAKAAGRPLIEAGPISRQGRRGGARVDNYFLSAVSANTLGDAAFGLLRDAAGEQRHPRTLVELPRDAKVVVAELDSVDRLPTVDPIAMTRDATATAWYLAVYELAADWFNPDSIRHRLDWRPIETASSEP